MAQSQAAGMQEMARQTESLSVIWSIKRVAYDGIAVGRQMDANLVRHAGLHLDLQ